MYESVYNFMLCAIKHSLPHTHSLMATTTYTRATGLSTCEDVKSQNVQFLLLVLDKSRATVYDVPLQFLSHESGSLCRRFLESLFVPSSQPEEAKFEDAFKAASRINASKLAWMRHFRPFFKEQLFVLQQQKRPGDYVMLFAMTMNDKFAELPLRKSLADLHEADKAVSGGVIQFYNKYRTTQKRVRRRGSTIAGLAVGAAGAAAFKLKQHVFGVRKCQQALQSAHDLAHFLSKTMSPQGQPNFKVSDCNFDWKTGKQIACGTQGCVYDVTNLHHPDQQYVVKKTKDCDVFGRDVAMLSTLKSDIVPRLVEAFVCPLSTEPFNIVMEKLDGTIDTFLASIMTWDYDENEMRPLTHENKVQLEKLIKCLFYIRSEIVKQLFLYFDWHTANVMRDGHGQWVLIDFGLTKQFASSDELAAAHGDVKDDQWNFLQLIVEVLQVWNETIKRNSFDLHISKHPDEDTKSQHVSHVQSLVGNTFPDWEDDDRHLSKTQEMIELMFSPTHQ